MLKRRPLNPPQHIYPVDPWRMIEKEFYPRFLAQAETIFSLGNHLVPVTTQQRSR